MPYMSNEFVVSVSAAMPAATVPSSLARCYAPARALFDAMAATYGFAPWLAGGLRGRWRR